MNLFDGLAISAATASALLLFLQVRVASRAIRLDHLRRRRQSTLEFVMAQVRPRWSKSRKLIDEKWGTESISEKALKQIEEDDKSREVVRSLLGHLEYLAVGINVKVYDKDVLHRASGSYLIRTFHRLLPYVKSVQKKQPAAYVELEQLIADFAERKRHKPEPIGELGDV